MFKIIMLTGLAPAWGATRVSVPPARAAVTVTVCRRHCLCRCHCLCARRRHCHRRWHHPSAVRTLAPFVGARSGLRPTHCLSRGGAEPVAVQRTAATSSCYVQSRSLGFHHDEEHGGGVGGSSRLARRQLFDRHHDGLNLLANGVVRQYWRRHRHASSAGASTGIWHASEGCEYAFWRTDDAVSSELGMPLSKAHSPRRRQRRLSGGAMRPGLTCDHAKRPFPPETVNVFIVHPLDRPLAPVPGRARIGHLTVDREAVTAFDEFCSHHQHVQTMCPAIR